MEWSLCYFKQHIICALMMLHPMNLRVQKCAGVHHTTPTYHVAWNDNLTHTLPRDDWVDLTLNLDTVCLPPHQQQLMHAMVLRLVERN